jgi:stearoyl-CoA desaturase (delta-9 desaturase)
VCCYRRIRPAENLTVSILALGEGWHNYHHVFPWDYKAAELGRYTFNITTAVIDFFSLIGWAYDLRVPTEEMVRRTVEKKGDGTHPHWAAGSKRCPELQETVNHETEEETIKGY